MPRKKTIAERQPVQGDASEAWDSSESVAIPCNQPDCMVVGIGASAGGIDAITTLLRNLPTDIHLSLIFVAHLAPNQESLLPTVLAGNTRIPVVQAKNDQPVECNHMYVIPPNHEMVISGGVLKLRPFTEGTQRYLPIDTFFRSLAEDQKTKAVGVVLSGNASDGTIGLKAIKAEGGLTFAQDATAKFDSMPRTAIASGVVDFVLPPEAIARELASLANHPYIRPKGPGTLDEDGPLATILEMLRREVGIDFTQYKQPTIQRRTIRRMVMHRLDRPEEYVDYLRKHRKELQELSNDLLINVTEFFRDPDTFSALREIAFPKIFNTRQEGDPVRVWVPACSTGEEVYSIAISMLEYMEENQQRFDLQIFGTDVSETAVNRARTGFYPKVVASSMSQERLRRFFAPSDHGYQIGRQIRECCIFSRQDLMRDPPLSRMDLVTCRNLLIYLRPAMQTRLGALLHYSLKPTGCLLLGNSESLGAMSRYFSTLDRQHKIYCRNTSAGEPILDLPPRALFQTALPARGTTGSGEPPVEPAELAQQYINRHLAEFSPRAIVTDERGLILIVRGNVVPFLKHQVELKQPILSAVVEGLVEPLRMALMEAHSEDEPVLKPGIVIREDGVQRKVDLRVVRVSLPQQGGWHLIIFQNLRDAQGESGQDEPVSGKDDAVRYLEQKLESTRQYLQTVIEELRSANEEVQSTNEELQSTNEELQTAKEELQASNEELRTINDEMQSRNAELSQAHNDLLNLLSSMNVPVLMLDNHLRIRRFTPASEKILHLIATDIGRPIGDLQLRIQVKDLEDVLRDVINTPTVYEREVQDEEGRWYSMRVRPYRTTEHRIEGAVLQLVDIDAIKRGLELVREARDYAEAVVNTVREPLAVVQANGRIRTANAAFHQQFQVGPESIVDRPLTDVVRSTRHTQRLTGLLDKATSHKPDLHEVEIECEFRDGGPRTFVVNARSIHTDESPGLVLMAFEDVTERRLEAEARYRRLFEAAKDGILISSAETGEITDANPFIETISGYSPQELIGQKLWEVPALAELPDLKKAVSRIREEGVVRFPDVTIRTKDGRQLQTEVVANVYSEKKGRVIQFNVRDISERKKFFRQIQESQKLESLGLLAGGIAHDFNNLLTGILGNVSLALADTPPDQPWRVFLRDAIRGAEQAAHLTRQMLAYAGKGQFITEPLDVSALIREMHSLIQSSVSKSVQLQLDLAEDPPLVRADRAQLQQLIMNLIINGAEAIPEEKGGTVLVRTGVRQLAPADIAENFSADELEAGKYVILEVRDTGCGMDEGTKAKIFDPFFTTKFTGRGLGLAATLGIVKGHRGALRVYSTPGHGSTFSVWLPTTRENVARAKDEPLKAIEPGSAAILVIDDDTTVRAVAERSLKRYGYQVLTANDGLAGVEVFRQNRDRIALVLLDLTMPVMGGDEAIKGIKEMRPDIPVVLSSGYDQAEAMRRFGSSDVAGFLQKPYSMQQLLERVKQVLDDGNL